MSQRAGLGRTRRRLVLGGYAGVCVCVCVVLAACIMDSRRARQHTCDQPTTISYSSNSPSLDAVVP